jgi:RNA polymerase sigma-70 factor (ECF subfamily)
LSLKSPINVPVESTELLEDVRIEGAQQALLREERAVAVRKAIAHLPEKQRATLILRTYHEMSHQEIADVLGSSVGAVKANFFHALNNLKKILGSEP